MNEMVSGTLLFHGHSLCFLVSCDHENDVLSHVFPVEAEDHILHLLHSSSTFIQRSADELVEKNWLKTSTSRCRP